MLTTTAEPKGARKRALDLMRLLDDRNAEVVQGTVEVEKANLRLKYVTRERDIVMADLKDLITRCMESFGSDEGK